MSKDKKKRQPKKLDLTKTSVRKLTDDQLEQVPGALPCNSGKLCCSGN